MKKCFYSKGLFLIATFLLFNNGLSGQEAGHQHETATHQHGHAHHEHGKNEIGIANNIVYLGEEKEFAYALHLHYVRTIKSSPFGLGLGFEQIFDEHLHRTIGIVGSYMPFKGLILNITPGITFIGRAQAEKSAALHLEVTYEFELGPVHLGPLMEYAITGHGYHLSGGLHVAFAF